MTELERIDDPAIVQDDGGVWDQAINEWTAGHAEELKGKLRQARAAAAVGRFYGLRSMEKFATELKVSKSLVYDYAHGYNILLSEFGTHEQVSERLEDSPLRISNILEAAREEDVPKALDEAEDEGLSSRQQKARRKEREVPENVEIVTEVVCPACGCVSPMSQVETRTVQG